MEGEARLWFHLKWFEQFFLIFWNIIKKEMKETKRGWILLKFVDVYTLPFITHQTFNISWIEINERSYVDACTLPSINTSDTYIFWIMINVHYRFKKKKGRKIKMNHETLSTYIYIYIFQIRINKHWVKFLLNISCFKMELLILYSHNLIGLNKIYFICLKFYSIYP